MSTILKTSSGNASGAVDVTELLGMIDKLTDGAASGFVRVTKAALEPVEKDAAERMPVATGELRDSIEQRVRVDSEGVAVSLGAWAGKAKFVKFSKFTTAALEEDIQRKIARGTTPEARAKIEAHARKRSKAMHGMGAPTEALRARSVTVELIRKPGRAKEKEIAAAAAADLGKLAGELA